MGEWGPRTLPWPLQPAAGVPQGGVLPSDASRKKGNRSGKQPEFSAQAVQHEDIFQAAAKGNF